MVVSHRLSVVFTCSMVLIFFSLAAHAGWQVAQPSNGTPREPFFQTNAPRRATYKPYVPPVAASAPIRRVCKTAPTPMVYASRYANLGQAAPRFAVSISGSLKDNIERILNRYHWKVIWKAPFDYNFDGRVTGSSLQNVLEKLLQPFPLQAQMYMANRIVTIVPRVKKDI